MATNTSLQVHSTYIHGYQHITPSTLRVHPWLPTHHSKYTQRTSMATNTSLQVPQRTPMVTNTSLQVHSEYTHGYQHISPSTLRVHPWLPTHLSKYTQSTPMATNTSLQVHSAYIHGYQHITPSTYPWLPTHLSKYTQRTSMATNTSHHHSIRV